MRNDTAPLGRTLADSRPRPSEPPFDADKPNVLVIVLDDLGFAQLGCYGSDIDTPNIDRLASRGVRFSNFHTTAICSPTRACLLTGRNHHRVGMGMLPDLPLNYRAYTGRFPEGAGTLAAVLRDQGWSTNAIGKWHLVPRDQRATGPYDMWPTGVGFDRYYGFLNGETNQWTPNLIRDQSHVEPPATPDEGYHLDADLADEAVNQLRELRLANSRRPWMLWYATGSPHAPHQVPPEWIDRYEGRFDDGWDLWREHTLTRQKELGMVPEDVALSERPEWVEGWDDVDADRRRLYARMMEVYAAFISHMDHHIGRVLDHLEETGEVDNTIVALLSDNGCSAEGGPNGSWNQLSHYFSDEADDLDRELSHHDDLGGFRSSGHYPWGWALAGNTPFRRWKRYTFEGGIRDPLIISWPAGLSARGELRDQYCHAVDVMPTVLDLAGVAAPPHLDGTEQMSIDGVPLGPILEAREADEVRTEQYFECWGSRAFYADGWKAVTNHVNQLTPAERENIVGSHDFATDEWALFDTRTDFTESTDLSSVRPEKLADLVDRWTSAAERNQVFPLDDSRDNRAAQIHVPWFDFRDRFDLCPGDKLHEAAGPMLFGGFRLVAAFDPPLETQACGVLIEQGDWIAGWAWFLNNGVLSWVLTLDGEEHRVTGAVPDGARILSLDATHPESGGLDLALAADGTTIGTAESSVGIPMVIHPDGAFFTVGYGRPFPVCDDYQPPSPAPASLSYVSIRSGPPAPLDLDAEISCAMRHQ